MYICLEMRLGCYSILGQYTIVLMEYKYMYILKSFKFCLHQLVMKNESGDYKANQKWQ